MPTEPAIARRLAEIHDRMRMPAVRLTDIQADAGLARCAGCQTAARLDLAARLCPTCLAQLPAHGGSRTDSPLFRA